jgi:hypothetical protein
MPGMATNEDKVADKAAKELEEKSRPAIPLQKLKKN